MESIGDYVERLAAPEQADYDLAEAICRLPAKYKDVVYLYYYEGYTTAEIASLLGYPQATVRSHLSRARMRLSALLKEESE